MLNDQLVSRGNAQSGLSSRTIVNAVEAIAPEGEQQIALFDRVDRVMGAVTLAVQTQGDSTHSVEIPQDPETEAVGGFIREGVELEFLLPHLGFTEAERTSSGGGITAGGTETATFMATFHPTLMATVEYRPDGATTVVSKYAEPAEAA